MKLLRLARFALASNLRALPRFGLMCALIAVGVTVFLTVSELSRASTDSLDEAITAELGANNQYSVTFNSDLGLDQQALRSRAAETVTGLRPARLIFVDQLPRVRPVCPPYQDVDEVAIYVLRDADGSLTPFSGRLDLDGDYDLCLAGQVVPATALRETTPIENRAFGNGIVIDGGYQRLVQLAGGGGPTRVAMIVQFGDDVDRSAPLREAVETAFSDDVARAGTSLDRAVVTSRVDDGAQVRAASDAIRLVYGLIGWGILVIVGLGILVAQLVILRDRTWLLGLSRAVGARRLDLALLVAVDVGLMLLVGTTFALTVCVAGQSAILEFGQQAFQTRLQLVRWDAMPALLGAILLTLGVGAGYPMVKAVRLDPVDVLERR